MPNTLLVYTDGGAKGNPGPAAIGVYITDGFGREIARINKQVGETTNNRAEYLAVIEALRWVKDNFIVAKKFEKIKFFLDSKLVVNQLNGIFKIKGEHLRELVIKAKMLEKEIDKNISYIYVSRGENKIADSLVNASFRF